MLQSIPNTYKISLHKKITSTDTQDRYNNYTPYHPPNSGGGGGVYIGVGLSVRPSVCSFLSALFLINYWTNFIQTSQVNLVSSRDVHMKCWLWFIDLSLSYGPFMKFLVLHSCDNNLFCDKELLGGYDHV